MVQPQQSKPNPHPNGKKNKKNHQTNKKQVVDFYKT
jgi:hypothetical protein